MLASLPTLAVGLLLLPAPTPTPPAAARARCRLLPPLLMVAATRSASLDIDRSRSFGRKRDAAVSDEAMRWYLTSIGTRSLLDNDEEVRLASAVKELLRWLRVRHQLIQSLGRPPDRAEWAAAVGGFDAGDAAAHQRFDDQLRIMEMAKDRMITSNLRLVVSIAKKYANRGVNIQDLIQEGSFGLITAVDKFDPHHKCRFSTYAHYWIKQSVTRALADYSRTIRLPVHMNDCVNSIRKTRTNFFLSTGRQPSDEELAASLRISQSKLRLALASSRELVSLEAPCFVNKRASDDKAWLDLIPDEAPKPESFLETALLQEQIHNSLLAALHPLEREVLSLRYGLEGRDRRSFDEIGAVFEMPKERVRQIEARALRKLKRPQQHHNLKHFDPHRQYK